MEPTRFELVTARLSAECSTTELRFQWAGRDLNPRRQSRRIYSPFPLTTRTPTLDGVSVIHLKDVTVTYPLSYHSRQVYLQALMVTAQAGIEPATKRLTVVRSTAELLSNKITVA